MANFLPDYLAAAHDLCLMNHDILVELLRSGEDSGLFQQDFCFKDEADRNAFEESEDIFDWLDKTRRDDDYSLFLRRTVFPAVLSDLLHFIYEALETSRKAKLTVSYALIRKPLQESLCLLEWIISDPTNFVAHMRTRPQELRSQKAGGWEQHAKRIEDVLRLIGESRRFDATYLAKLRYDKKSEDSFDGICNLATHLITDHAALRTERLNINFIFSGWDEKLTQWYFLYSRLPYLLFYIRRLTEHVAVEFGKTDPVYLDDIERRVAAATILWWPAVPADYKCPQLETFVRVTEHDLVSSCVAHNYHIPKPNDLARMRATGAWPGESALRVRLRVARYKVLGLRRRIVVRLSARRMTKRPTRWP
jgi:hypothetical protein